MTPPPKRSIATTRAIATEDAADGGEDRRSAGEEPAAGKALRGDGAAEERGDGRIDRQRIVRQLGGHGLEDEEARDEPGEAEADGGIAALAPDPLRRRRQEGGGRPEDEPEQGEMRAGRGGVALLAAAELAEEIVPDRLADEIAAGDREDRDEPGEHDRRRERHPDERPQPEKPAGIAGRRCRG